MHTDLVDKIIARRLRALADQDAAASGAEAPYDWAEFRRRRRGAAATSSARRHRLAAMAAAVVAAAVIAGVAFVRSSHQRAPAVVSRNRTDSAAVPANGMASDRLVRARTRAIEGWLAGLPRDPAVVRVGAHAAVTSLQDQIAALDDLMSVERAADAKPSRLDALERQRAVLVSSLAQLRYAEMLASATP